MSSLATRCAACGTVFRVVPDQLRVSEGWVRCGRCSQVFNALESLVDLDTGLPRRDGGVVVGSSLDSAAAALDIAHPAPRPDAATMPSLPSAPAPVPLAPALNEDFASTAADSRQAGETGETVAPPSAADGSDDLRADPALAPSFVRQADRAARWRRPGVRAGLAGVALLAAAGLAAQVAHTWRDRLAAQVPSLAPALTLACAWTGCTLGPARRLEAWSVESSGLVRVERSNLYRLQVTLRNNADHAVALPALDLALTDGRGELVARRVVALSELGAATRAGEPGRELALQGTLQSEAAGDGDSPVIAGYTVELFYP